MFKVILYSLWRPTRLCLILAIALPAASGALHFAGSAAARDVNARVEEDIRRTRLEMRGSDGQVFRPRSFLFAAPDGASRVAAPRNFSVDEASRLPAARLPLIGGIFRQEFLPPPNVRGAPVYAIGDEMAVDLGALAPADLEIAKGAALTRQIYIISRTRQTVVSIRPIFNLNRIESASIPNFGNQQIGEAFVNGQALIIVPLERNFFGTRLW